MEHYPLDLQGLTSTRSRACRRAPAGQEVRLPTPTTMTVVCGYAPNSSQENLLNGVLLGVPVGDSIVLLGDCNTHMGNNGDNQRGVIGRNSLPDLSPSRRLFLVFGCCAPRCFWKTNRHLGRWKWGIIQAVYRNNRTATEEMLWGLKEYFEELLNKTTMLSQVEAELEAEKGSFSI